MEMTEDTMLTVPQASCISRKFLTSIEGLCWKHAGSTLSALRISKVVHKLYVIGPEVARECTGSSILEDDDLFRFS